MATSDCHARNQPGPLQWRSVPDGFEEAVQFVPGYNCTKGGLTGHGVHGMEISWYLRGPLGAACFKIFTSWIPGQLRPGHGLMPDGHVNPTWIQYPMGADVGYHTHKSQYEDQEPAADDCPIIGGLCYYDGSGLRAEELTRIFIELGELPVWAELHSVYERIE